MTGSPRAFARALPIRSLVFTLLAGAGIAYAQAPTPPIGGQRVGAEATPTIRTAITAAPLETATPADPADPTDPAAGTITAPDPAASTPIDPDATPDPIATIAPALPASEISTTTAAPEAKEIVSLEPGADRGLVLPAFSGQAGTVLGDESLFASLTALQKAWFVREYHRARGDAPAAEKATETLLDLKLDTGVENATAIAAALCAEARTLLGESKKAEAVASATAATSMAPDYASAWTTLARAEISNGAIGGALGALRQAAGASSRNLRSNLRIIGNAGFAVIGGAFLAWVVFLLVGFARHFRFLAHDFRHALADNMPGWIAGVILLPFLAFPIVFGGGIIAVLAWWSLVLWIKLSPRERVVCGAFLAFGAASPFLIERASTTLSFEAGDAGRLFAAAREDEIAPRELAELSAFADETKDPAALLTLAIGHQRAGRYSRAREAYAAARDAGATYPALIGLGNVHYALGEIPQAVESFEKAVATDPSRIAGHFNLSQLHAERTQLDQATSALGAAKRIDAEAAEHAIRRMLPPSRKLVSTGDPAAPQQFASASYVNRFLMVEPVADATILARARDGAREVAHRSWSRISPAVPLAGVTWVFAATLALCLVLTAASRGSLPSRPCPRCGRGLCLRCDGPPLDDDLCTQCWHAFIHKEGVDPRQRAAKEDEIARHHMRGRRYRKLLSLLVPGSGQLLAGETLPGIVLMVIASIALVRLLFWRGIFRPTVPVPGSITPIVVAALAGAVLLATWIIALRMKAPEERRA